MLACPFVWYDLMTADQPAATRFYESVAGWTSADSGLTDREYKLMFNGPAWTSPMVAGIMGMPDHLKSAGVRSAWNGHIGVDDVDAYTEKVVAAGGSVHRAPENIPNGIGRFSAVAGPHGAVFVLFRGAGQPPAPPPAGTPGMVGWNELHAGDGKAAFAFYSELFGWTDTGAVDMGLIGIYQMFSTGCAPVGGIMTKTPETPAPTWVFYINVDGIDAGVERITSGGGQVVMGPQTVPGGSWIAQAIDPEGTLFAITSLTK
jgi:predicted enzyme related to lactoylglutathione lyase